jgi:hypothetical protein
MNLTRFMISDTQYLTINPEDIDKDACEVCAKIDIDYIDEEKNLCIKFENEALSDFCYKITKSGHIQKLIHGKMPIDSSIAGDLGFEWNQYFEGIIKDTEVIKYHFSSNCHKQIRPYYNSWLYNDKDGNVIFEITPFYPWHRKKKSHPDFITYKQFMKDYKPILKTLIPKENLKQWFTQARELEKIYFPQFEST